MSETKTCLSELTKHCRHCSQTLPLSRFGDDRSRKNGKNPYCKKCTCRRNKQFCQATQELKRKGLVFSGSSRQKITKAVSCGFHSRAELRRVTRLGWDVLTDCLAVLAFDEKVLTTKVIHGERCFYIRRAA